MHNDQMLKKKVLHVQVEFIPEMKVWFNIRLSINIIYCIKTLNRLRKTFDKIQPLFRF